MRFVSIRAALLATSVGLILASAAKAVDVPVTVGGLYTAYTPSTRAINVRDRVRWTCDAGGAADAAHVGSFDGGAPQPTPRHAVMHSFSAVAPDSAALTCGDSGGWVSAWVPHMVTVSPAPPAPTITKAKIKPKTFCAKK